MRRDQICSQVKFSSLCLFLPRGFFLGGGVAAGVGWRGFTSDWIEEGNLNGSKHWALKNCFPRFFPDKLSSSHQTLRPLMLLWTWHSPERSSWAIRRLLKEIEGSEAERSLNPVHFQDSDEGRKLILAFSLARLVTLVLAHSICLPVNNCGAYHATNYRGSRGSAQTKPDSTKARTCLQRIAQ